MRELKIGDRVVDWKDRAGVVLSSRAVGFTMRYDEGEEVSWGWVEFGSDEDFNGWHGTFRFEDTEYPEWPR